MEISMVWICEVWDKYPRCKRIECGDIILGALSINTVIKDMVLDNTT